MIENMPQIDRAQHYAQRLDEALDHIQALLPTLARLLPERDTGGPRTGTIGHSTPDGSEPWNSQVADVLTRIWFGLPGILDELRVSIGMDPLLPGHRTRPAETIRAIRSCLTSATGEAVEAAARRCERWVSRAQQLPAIDEAEPWVQLPGLPHGGPPLCPYCHTTALRMRRRAGEVVCFMPDCVDGDGRPTRARMEAGRMTGESCLVFNDGTFMTFEGEQ